MNIYMYTQRFALTAMAALLCHATVYAQTSADATSTAQLDAPAVTNSQNGAADAASSAGGAPPAASPAATPARAPRATRSSATANKQITYSVQPAAKNAAVAGGSKASGTSAVAATTEEARALADAQASKPAVIESHEGGVRIMRGNDRVIAPPRVPARVEGPASTFKFEEAPISEVVHVMLGEILKVDYVLHQPVAGSVTLATRGNVSADQAIFLLESALQANGIVMARDARGVYHVGRADVLKGIVSAPRQVGFGALPPGSGAVIVPLQYIGAAEMATILRPMIAPDALLRVDTLRNLLVLGGTRTQAEGWLELINTFDVDLLKGMSVGIFPLKYATVREVDQALRLMTGGAAAAAPSAGGSGAAPASAGGGGAAAAAAAAGNAAASMAEANPFFGAVRIMPLERISSILVVAPRASNLEEARKWIERFDRPSDNSTEAQLFVYPVQNGSAKHLASVLSGIFGGGGGQSATGGTGVSPGLGTSTSSTQGFGSQNQSQTGALLGMSNNSNRATPGFGSQNNQAGLGGQGNAGVTAMTLGQSGVRIIADEVNNAILIYAPRSEYAKLEASLRRLDIRSAQVLIEAMIVEVTLKDGLEYGLQWNFKDVRNNGNVGTGVLGTALGTATAGGFSYTLRNSADTISATLRALADKSLIKVISSPSVMVMDNQVASIVVGDQIPIKTGETLINSTTANTVTNFQYKDTGVNLAVTPSVNAGNIVTMQVAQSITDVGAKDLVTGQNSFTQRQIGTKVAIRSGETLVLGGLIKDNISTSKSGIPLLQDIPVAGKLFGSNVSSITRTELLVILTPRVLRSDEDARELNEEMRNQMKTFTSVERLDSRVGPSSVQFDSGALSAPPFNKGVITP